MRGTYDLWLVACSYLVAVAASYAALELAGRVVVAYGRSAWVWVVGGAIAMGLGIWSMHFIGMLAFHLPIPLTYEVPITLLSVVPAILSAALVLALVRGGILSGYRLTKGAILLGGGIAAMHYTGMAAIPIQPAVRYDPVIFTVSVAVAIAVAFVALKLAFSLSGSVSRWKKFGAALVMAGGICAMHYTGMGAANFAPDSICTVAPGAIQNTWLAGIIAFNTVIVLLVTVAIAIYDARLSDQNARTVQAMKIANHELVERTQRAERLTAELRASEERLRLMVGHLPAGAAYIDGESIYLNPRVKDITGYSPDELPTLDAWFAAVYPGKAAEIKQLYLADKSAGFLAPRVVSITRKDGAERLLEFTAYRDDAGEVWLMSDVTERVQAEEKFRILFEHSSDAHLIFDENGVIDCNNAALEMIGCADKRKILDLHPAVLSPQYQPDGRLSAEKAVEMDATAKRDGHHRFEWMHRRLDSTEFPVEVTLTPVDLNGRRVMLTVWHDLTKRKQAEQELKEAYEKLGSGVEALEQRNREIVLLAELGNFLISCVTVEEACNAVPKYCETLFPGAHGALYLLRASRDRLNPYASWGGLHDEVLSFKPDDCWALRRGRPHTVSDPQKDAICVHIDARHNKEPYVCVPLVVQSDLLGLIWISLARHDRQGSETDARMNGEQQLAIALSEQIALALSNIRLRENLREQTIRDALTGLYNRRFLEESLNREIARCKRNGTGFAVLMMDLDHFKRFNDSFGHEAGDSVLRSVAQVLQEHTRGADIACRLGGEEFVVVLPDTAREGAILRAERILAVVRNLDLTHNDKTLGSIMASIGLAMYPQDGETVKAVVQAADKALYAAKGAGRDQLVVATE